MPRCWTIAEFEGFCEDRPGLVLEPRDGFQSLPATHFAVLKELLGILPTPAGDEEESGAPLFSLSHDRRLGDVIKARNHVGVIAFADGSQIEILPKLARKATTRTPADTERHRELLLRMLRDAFDINPALGGPADLRLARLPLLEAFFRMFLASLERLVKRGLPGGYVRVESNERFFKGKLLVAEQLRQNLVRRERFCVAHDVFLSDTPSNRLLHSGLEYVRAHAATEENRRAADRLRPAFDEIPRSRDPVADFGASSTAFRDTLQREALRWCEVFLLDRGLANLPGTRRARAFLFPMETVFERSVARALRGHAPDGVEISVQEKKLFLFEESPHGSAFRLNPDIVIRRGHDILAIADTKWKLLFDEPGKNFGMSQSDLYQMYAYQKRYNAPLSLLIYPFHETLGSLSASPPAFRTPTDSALRVIFWNPANVSAASASAADVFAAALEPPHELDT